MRTLLPYILSLICIIALSHNITSSDNECDKCFQPYTSCGLSCDTPLDNIDDTSHGTTYDNLCNNDVSSNLRHSSSRQRNTSLSLRYKYAEVNHIKSINELHHNLHQISIENISPELLKSECSFIALRKLII